MRGPSRARVAFALFLKFLLSCLALLTAVAWGQSQASLKIYTFAGLIGVGDGGPAIEAPLRFPTGVVVDSAGNLYIADRGNHRIRKVDPTGTITTIASTEESGFGGDDGPATEAQLSSPTGIATDGGGNLYIADHYNHRIRKVDSTGTITTVAGTGEGGPERERVAWQRAEERGDWEQLQRRRGKALGELEKRSKREWSALYGRHQRQREQLAKDCRGVLGRFKLWRELGGGVREIGGAIRGQTEVLGRFRAELEDRLRWERVSLGKAHSEAVRGIESKAGEFYREGLEGSEKRAREAAWSDGLLLSYGSRPVDWYRINKLKHSVSEERLEQVREIDGEQAYEKMRRAVEKASQEKARQVESRPERRGPERGGPERDFGPSR